MIRERLLSVDVYIIYTHSVVIVVSRLMAYSRHGSTHHAVHSTHVMHLGVQSWTQERPRDVMLQHILCYRRPTHRWTTQRKSSCCVTCALMTQTGSCVSAEISLSLSPIMHGRSSSLPSSLSSLSSSLTRSVFHSELMTWLFDKSFPPLDSFHWLSDDHLKFLFCSSAGFVCMVSVFKRT